MPPKRRLLVDSAAPSTSNKRKTAPRKTALSKTKTPPSLANPTPEHPVAKISCVCGCGNEVFPSEMACHLRGKASHKMLTAQAASGLLNVDSEPSSSAPNPPKQQRVDPLNPGPPTFDPSFNLTPDMNHLVDHMLRHCIDDEELSDEEVELQEDDS